MANSLGITEVTLLQVSTAANAVNQIGAATGNRSEALKANLVRVLGHADDDAAETSDPDKMAIFVSKAHGHPWKKDNHYVEHVIHKSVTPGTPIAAPANATIIYPDYDYSTFE
jgi:hypothetical protein